MSSMPIWNDYGNNLQWKTWSQWMQTKNTKRKTWSSRFYSTAHTGFYPTARYIAVFSVINCFWITINSLFTYITFNLQLFCTRVTSNYAIQNGTCIIWWWTIPRTLIPFLSNIPKFMKKTSILRLSNNKRTITKKLKVWHFILTGLTFSSALV